mgnify:CR=1 FL=1
MNTKLTEFFGFPLEIKDEDAQYHRKNSFCPFESGNLVCHKTLQKERSAPVGSCSAYDYNKNSPLLICPTRFKERNNAILNDIAMFFWGTTENIFSLEQELKLQTPNSQNFGNVDKILVKAQRINNEFVVDDFIAIEFQTVNITGTLENEIIDAFEITKIPTPKGLSKNSRYTPGFNKYDSIKALYVQLLRKLQPLKHWNKKTAIVMQDILYDDMTSRFGANFTDQSNQLITFFVYNIDTQSKPQYSLVLTKKVSVSFEDIINAITNTPVQELPDLKIITEKIASKLREQNSLNQ